MLVDNLLEYVEIDLNSNYALPGDEDRSTTVMGQDIGFEGVLEWKMISPDSPPEEIVIQGLSLPLHCPG